MRMKVQVEHKVAGGGGVNRAKVVMAAPHRFGETGGEAQPVPAVANARLCFRVGARRLEHSLGSFALRVAMTWAQFLSSRQTDQGKVAKAAMTWPRS